MFRFECSSNFAYANTNLITISYYLLDSFVEFQISESEFCRQLYHDDQETTVALQNLNVLERLPAP